MRTSTKAAAITATLLLATLTACSGDSNPDEAACKAAMVKQMEDAKASGKEGTQPDACEGVDDKTLQRFAGEIISDQLGDIGATPTP